MDFKNILSYITPLAPFQWLGKLVNNAKGESDKPTAVESLFGNLLGKYAGTNLTDAEKEANAFSAEQAQMNRDFQEQMSNTEYQRGVVDMKAAGLNPALMMSRASGASAPSGSNASSVSPSIGSFAELMQLALLPAQIRNLNAQANLTDANVRYTQQKTLTEEQNTKLQSIAVQWQPSINAEQIANLSATTDKLEQEILKVIADTGVSVAHKDLIVSQTEAQAITNAYLPSRLVSEINKLDSDARSARASAWITEIQAKFADDNGFLMSSNDALLLGTYICSLFGVDKGNIENTISNAKNYVNKEFKYDFRPWRKVSPDEAIEWYLEHKN